MTAKRYFRDCARAVLSAVLLLTAVAARAEAPPKFVRQWVVGQSPYGIAANTNGLVYVGDGHRIKAYTAVGTLVSDWQLGFFAEGVAIDSQLHVFVYESTNQPQVEMVEKFTSDGTLLTSWVVPIPNGPAGHPGIAIDRFDNVYVLEFFSGNVYVYDGGGAPLRTFGTGLPAAAVAIDIDASDTVYIADAVNRRILKYTLDGALAGSWDTGGRRAADVAADGFGGVYVAGGFDNSVAKFDTGGVFLAAWGILGSGDGEFLGADTICTDSAGNIYVADQGNHRIQMFAPDTAVGIRNTAWSQVKRAYTGRR